MAQYNSVRRVSVRRNASSLNLYPRTPVVRLVILLDFLRLKMQQTIKIFNFNCSSIIYIVLGTIKTLRNPLRGRSLKDYIRLQGGEGDTPQDHIGLQGVGANLVQT